MPSSETLRLFEITGVAQDSRRLRPGFLFIARKGERFDSHNHLAEAVAAGAVVIVGERPLAEVGPIGAPYVQVGSSKQAIPFLAAAFYRHPSSRMRVIGVTGTDGKTTTSYLTHWLLAGSMPCALSSTAGIFIGEAELPPGEGHFTTPEATEVQALLARFVDGGATHAVLESSSHGFAQHRLDAVEYAVGVFTNLSPEHLDFHKTYEAYAEAKATLMRRAKLSVINRDDAAFELFTKAAQHKVITYGVHPQSDVRILGVQAGPHGLSVELAVHGDMANATLPMVGRYNAHNAAAAIAVAEHEGVPVSAVLARLAGFPGVPGRMQLISTEPTVIVDFAHTADALTKALNAVRRPGSRLIVVVGSAGERDPGKRAPIGKAAVEGADYAVLTEEDSRSEDVHAILTDMKKGAEAAGGTEGKQFMLEPDRAAAIRLAIEMAKPGDIVLLAGKGPERTLERMHETMPWDEAAEARAALAECR